MPGQSPPGLGAIFYTVRVVSVITPGSIGYKVEHRSRWWPFWRRAKTLYVDKNAAIAAAQAYQAVRDYLVRTVDEPLVVWKG